MSHLNVQGLDSTGNYAVYGLPVSQQGIQAQVDHANLYLSSLVPSLTSTDPRYSFAQLAALDLACMAVLVAASGGMLLGAADYKLGDLFVTFHSFSYNLSFALYLRILLALGPTFLSLRSLMSQ